MVAALPACRQDLASVRQTSKNRQGVKAAALQRGAQQGNPVVIASKLSSHSRLES